MGQRLLMVNILILIGIVVLARYVTNAWHSYEETQNISAVLGNLGKGKPQDVSVEVPPGPEPRQPFPNYTVIAEKDLFMPERRPAPPPAEEVKVVAPQMPKKPSLNGVLNNRGKKQALVTIWEGNNPKGLSRTVSVGDDIYQGWRVSEIADTTMKLRWNDQEMLIDMFDSSPQQQPAVPPRTSAAVTVITIGSPMAPVETTEATEAPAGQRAGGLEVGVAGAQGGQRGPGQGGLGQGGRGNVMGNDAMRGGTMNPGTVGYPGGSSVPFTSGTRRRQTGP